MPAQRVPHSAPRERDKKPYDRPKPKPSAGVGAGRRPASPRLQQGGAGGLTRSTSLLGGIARLVSRAGAWLGMAGGEGEKPSEGAGEEGGEEAMLVEEGVRPEKRRQTSPGMENARRKRPRYAPPPPLPAAGTSRGFADPPIPDLQASMARRRREDDAERMPPPPAPLGYAEMYHPAFQRLSAQRDAHDRSRSVVSMDMYGVQLPSQHAPTQRFGTPTRSPFARPLSAQPERALVPSHQRGQSLAQSDRMSVDGPASVRRSGQMAWPSQPSPTRSQPPQTPSTPSSRMQGNHAEQILRALESFKTPLSLSRAPVLPASRIHVPKPDVKPGEGPMALWERERDIEREKRFAGTPYEKKGGKEKEKEKEGGRKGRKVVLEEEEYEDYEDYDENMEAEEDGKGKEREETMEDDELMPPPPVPKTKKSKPAPRPAAKGRTPPTKAPVPKVPATDETVPQAEKAVQAAPPLPTTTSTTTTVHPVFQAAAASVPSSFAIPAPATSTTIHPAFAAAEPAAQLAGEDSGFHVVDSYDQQKGKSSLRVGKEIMFRKHQSAAGSKPGATPSPAQKPKPKTRGGNVFRMPEDEDDAMGESAPEEKGTEKAKPAMPSAQEVAAWFKPPAEGETKEIVPVRFEQKDFFSDSIKRLEAKAASSTPPVALPKFGLLGAGAGSSTPTPLPGPAQTQPTQVVFSANVSTSQPTLTFGPPAQPKPADAASAPKPSLSAFNFPSAGPAQFGGFGVPAKPVEEEKKTPAFGGFGVGAGAGTSTGEGEKAQPPKMLEGPSPFGEAMAKLGGTINAAGGGTGGETASATAPVPALGAGLGSFGKPAEGAAKPLTFGAPGSTFGAGSSPFGSAPAQPSTAQPAATSGFNFGQKFPPIAGPGTFGQPKSAESTTAAAAPSTASASATAPAPAPFGNTFPSLAGGFGSSFTQGPIKTPTPTPGTDGADSKPSQPQPFGSGTFGQPTPPAEAGKTTPAAGSTFGSSSTSTTAGATFGSSSTTPAAGSTFGSAAGFSFAKPGDQGKTGTSSFQFPKPGGTGSFGSGTPSMFGAPASTAPQQTDGKGQAEKPTGPALSSFGSVGSAPFGASGANSDKPPASSTFGSSIAGPASALFGRTADKPTPYPLGGPGSSTDKPAFGKPGSAFPGFGQATGSSPFGAFGSASKPGSTNTLGLSTEAPAAAADKQASSAKPLFGGTTTQPPSVFGMGTSATTTTTTPGLPFGAPPTSTTPTTEPPKTPAAKDPSPDKMETSPVRGFKSALPTTTSTTPFGAPPGSKPAFPTFGSSPFGTSASNAFGSGASTSKPGDGNPFSHVTATTPGSTFNFNFSSGAGTSNPFGQTPGGSTAPTSFAATFGQTQPATRPTSSGAVQSPSTPTAFGAQTTTPERTNQPGAGGSFFPGSTSFQFGSSAQPSPFGATGGLSGTPPLAFGQTAAAGPSAGVPGSETGSPQLNNAAPGTPGSGIFNLGAADASNSNTPRKLKGMPVRRKR